MILLMSGAVFHQPSSGYCEAWECSSSRVRKPLDSVADWLASGNGAGIGISHDLGTTLAFTTVASLPDSEAKRCFYDLSDR